MKHAAGLFLFPYLRFSLFWLAVWLGGELVAADRIPWTSGRIEGSPYPPAPYSARRVFPKITFKNPVEFNLMPGSDRWVVAEQGGKLWSFRGEGGAEKADLAADLRAHHEPFDSVLGFAFHPGFLTNRFVFINYNEPGGRTNGSVISRFRASALDPLALDLASERVIIRWLSGGHNGCALVFGNDGMLYFSTGDATAPDPPDMPYKTGQDISDLLSSILRIDVDHPSPGMAYSIPADNPFAQMAGARGEVWAFGFRNPFRISVDRATGDLWAGDVGWEQWEMIYRIQKGGNYGWALTEGPNLTVRTDVKQGPGPILPPMVSIPHTDGASITGGTVYRGKRLPGLHGAYVYGDWETGRFWGLRYDGDKPLANEELCDTTLKPVSFALDASGELLILDYNGGIYELAPNLAGSVNESFPRRLSQTGLFTSMQPLQPAPGTVSYAPLAPMWNDHATAEWLVAAPGRETIVTAGGVGNIAGGTWFFPSNTVLARTLTLEMEAGKEASRRRIETQVLHWDGQAWNPYSYRWNAEGADAELVLGAGANEVFVVRDANAPGGKRETPWRFMSRSECLRCHNAWSGEALTLNWLQLGRPNRGGGSEREFGDSPAALLQAKGVLAARNPPGQNASVLVNPYDEGKDLAARARSWLHVNCSDCHRFGAGGNALIQLNFDRPDAEMRALDERAIRGDFGIRGGRILMAGDPYHSTLFYRVSTEGAGRMPHIGSRLADERGVALLRDWIKTLSPTAKALNDPEAAAARALSEQHAGLVRRMGESGRAREEALAQLAGETSGGLRLMAEGAALETRSAFARVAAREGNAFVRDLFQRWLPADERRRTLGIEVDPETILSLRGHSERGRAIFEGTAQCVRCHQTGELGRSFGPDLVDLGKKYTRAQVLEQLLAPSKVIAPEFRTTVLSLKEERELSGFVVKRAEEFLVLRDETLTEHTVKLGDVKESHESVVSAMPEGLLAPLTAQEAADLLEFLMSGSGGKTSGGGR